ncbi:MAG TPA: LON peptidase substrate-binding domain-containing protein [Streptosporangiaceae bacterium]|nr:LON peptidase substrate-binding domain-containing protein [Streptosporangiaceae bacterium]
MTELPLFPLGTVLFPGMVLPLNVFEDRYRALVRDLLASPEPRRFGVIAIREGRETGADGITSLYDVGCVAELREARPHDDGGFDLVTVGTARFRLGEVDRTREYLVADVELIPDDEDADAATVGVPAAQTAFRGYLDALVAQGGAVVEIHDLPDEPLLLSYVIAAAMIIDLPQRQTLLAAPDTLARLDVERKLLASETAMLRHTTSRPAPDLRYSPYSPN